MKHLKKIISVNLILALIIGLLIPSFTASAGNNEYPIVYLYGQGTQLFKEAGNNKSESIYPIDIDSDYILDTIDKLNPVFLKGLLTDDYDDYCDVIYDAVAAKFQPFLTDKDGNVTDGSGIAWTWSDASLQKIADKQNGNYGLKDFRYQYDWRLDPCTVADGLNDFIQAVMRVTGTDKVNLVSRCLGSNIASAYLVEYGYSNVNKCIFYASATEGIDICNEAFSNQLELDPDCIERFAYDVLGDYISDAELLEFVKTTVSLLNKTYGLQLATDFVTTIYDKVKANIVPRLLRTTIASIPSYLSMTDAKSYELIKKTMFGGLEDEYAGTIEKGDVYHYTVQNHIEDVLKAAKNDGVSMMIVAKYGYQFLPIIKSGDEISDRWLEISSATFGATAAANVTSAFSNEYINSAKANGTYKYISPDKQIDVSTALFPDYTWVIKRLEHKTFPESADKLLMAFIEFDGQMTVNDDPNFPQYMIYDSSLDRLSPMTEDNNDITGWNTDGLITLIIRFIKQAIPLLIKQISKSISAQ